MHSYKIWFRSPVLGVHPAVRNLGSAIPAKAGVFTVRLLDEDGDPLAQHECKLPVSQNLGECYVYVPPTPAGGLILMGSISASRAFHGIEIHYRGVFTDTPLAASQLGPLFCAAALNEGQGGQAVTKVARLQIATKGDQQ